MQHKAHIVMIGEMKSIPPELVPFVEFKGGLERRALLASDRVAILQIDDIESYYPVFLDGNTKISDVEDELGRIASVLDDKSKAELIKAIGTPASAES